MTRIPLLRAAPALVVLALGLGATVATPPRPLLVWNASESAPIGLYLVRDRAVTRGDMVIAWPPVAARALAARRHYLPANVPLVKRVAASVGDRVCAHGATLTVNGRLVATRNAHDGIGRPMPSWRGCVTLGEDVLLLLMPGAASFDGRYFGPTRRRDIVGSARLIWRR